MVYEADVAAYVAEDRELPAGYHNRVRIVDGHEPMGSSMGISSGAQPVASTAARNPGNGACAVQSRGLIYLPRPARHHQTCAVLHADLTLLTDTLQVNLAKISQAAYRLTISDYSNQLCG
jgi:hypothetical protein